MCVQSIHLPLVTADLQSHASHRHHCPTVSSPLLLICVQIDDVLPELDIVSLRHELIVSEYPTLIKCPQCKVKLGSSELLMQVRLVCSVNLRYHCLTQVVVAMHAPTSKFEYVLREHLCRLCVLEFALSCTFALLAYTVYFQQIHVHLTCYLCNERET